MQTLLQNVRFSLRMLARNPGLTVTVLLTLAIGIGANTAIFTVDYATLLAPLPYPKPDRLVMVWSKIQTYHNGVAAGDFLDWKQQNAVFDDLCAWSGSSFNLAAKDKPEYVSGNQETYSVPQMMGEPLLMGRYFLPEEGVDGLNHVVILTHKLWIKLGANPNNVGTALRMDGEPYTVVGVQRPGIFDRQESQLIVPLVFKPEQINHDFHWLLVMGRLKPGVTLKQAQQNMDSVTTHIAQVYPKSDTGWGSYVEGLKNDFLPKERIKMLWLLLGVVGFVLLIACVNVANLLLARGIARQKELAVRSALGAGRSAIFVQLLTESLILALVGGALGVGLGYAMLQGLAIHCRARRTCASTFPSCSSPSSPPRWPAFWPAPLQPGMHRASIPPRLSKRVDAPAPALASISCGVFWSSASSHLRLPCSPAPASPFTASGISPMSILASRPTTFSPSFCRCRKPAPKILR
jgi:putative ABC transport system permease protein